MTKAQLTLTSLVATLLCLVCFAPSVAQAAVTHKYLGSIEGFGRVIGVGVGPSEPEPAVEKSALYVADHNAGVVDRFSAANVPLPFKCVETKKCEGYVVGNALEGTPTGPLNGGHDGLEGGVVVNDETGEIYVSDSAVVDVFAATGEFLGQIKEVPNVPEAPVHGPFTGTVGLAFDQKTHELYVGNESQTAGVSSVVDVFAMEAGGGSKFKSQLGNGVLSEGGATSIAVAESGLLEGTVYVGARVPSELVYVFGRLGTLEATWRGTRTPAKNFGVQELSVAIDRGTGNVFVIDGGNGIVDEFPGSVAEEKPLGTVKGTPTGPGGSLVPFSARSDVAVAPESGDVYVASESVVDRFGPDLTIPDVEVGPSPVFAIESATHTWSATLNGRVDPDGAGPATCEFEYGLSTSYGTPLDCSATVPEGNAFASVHSDSIEGLPPGTTYFYRLDATNDADGETNTGQGSEDEGEFITPGPIIEKASASDVASSSATLDVTVNPNNAPTIVHFEYGRCSSPTTCSSSAFEFSTTPEAIGAGDTLVTVEPHVQGLVPSGVYHYRAVASSEIGPGRSEEFEGEEGSFTMQSPGGFGLPDGREWEMVSPPQKEGASIEPYEEGGEITQAAAAGGAFTYLTSVPTELTVAGYTNHQQVLSRRGPGGWVTQDLATEHNRSSGQSVEAGQEYRFFSEDLSRGILQPFGMFLACRSSEGAPQPCLSADASEQTAFMHTNFLNGNVDEPCTSSCYAPLVTGCPPEGQECAPGVKEHANVPAGTVFGQFGQGGAGTGGSCTHSKSEHEVANFCGPYFDGANPDASHVVINGPGTVVEEWSAGAPPSEQLQPIGLLPRNEAGEELPYAANEKLFLGSQSGGRGAGTDERHAISDDGSRVFWTAAQSEQTTELYMRENADRPPSPPPVGPCTATAGGCTIQIGGTGATFEEANAEGSKVFFKEGGSLYVCEIVEVAGKLQCKTTDLASVNGEVGWVVGTSEDGSYVYFATGCRLLGIEVESIEHKPCGGLYVAHESEGVWTSKFIASGAEEMDGQHLQEMTARVSPNGQWLAFVSDQDLTGYDTRDAASGQRDQEVYLYGAQTGRLACASCDPTGARPDGIQGNKVPILDGEDLRGLLSNSSPWLAGALPAWVEFYQGTGVYQPRYLSDSGRLFFDSPDALVPQDVNGTLDVYEYEPEGVGPEAARCGPAVASGSDVFKPAHAFEVEGRSGEEGAGCVGLISSGGSAQESAFMDASETGGDVFFMTTSKLAPQDFDKAYDVYDAHECTSVSPCIPPPPVTLPECVNVEACRAAPSPQPAVFGAPSSATFSGVGNLSPEASPPAPKKVTKKTVKCQKGKKLNHGKCVKKKSKPKKKTKAKKASRDRRAG
jgi:hypothetical protein